MNLHFNSWSIDNGALWQTIGLNLDQPQIDLDRSYFGGHSVLLQVLASDGLHTTKLRLGPYAITSNNSTFAS